MKQLSEMSLEELWTLFPIVLTAHSAEYALWFSEESASLRKLLRDFAVCRISHIGSTAVEGLLAKPIVDILLELPAGYDMNGVLGALTKAGGLLMARDEAAHTLALNKGYTPQGFAEKVFHLHVRPAGDWSELYFRDYLRQYPQAARQYEALKLALKEKYEHNRDAYTNAKTAFILEQTARARREFGGRYLPHARCAAD